VASTSPGNSITVRVEAPAAADATAALTAAVSGAGGALTALDVAESRGDVIVVDVTCDAVDMDHAERITTAITSLPGVRVHKVSDRTFLLHLGGKIEVVPKVPLKHRDDLSRAYTPGVARVCMAIVKTPEDVRRLTIKRNTVAVVTDGSAVLGLGNIGPAAALPVMEGKAALFKQFGGVDAWPVCLDTQDVEAIVEIVRAIAPVYGGINLEDISAPRCFEIEARLRSQLDIPVFHDDQHGTAIVVLGALTNALRVVGKHMEDISVVISGVGAAGHAIIRLLQSQGVSDIVACGREGVVHPDQGATDPSRRWIADHTNPRGLRGTLADVLAAADVFIGVSAPNLLSGADIARMADDAIVFAMANPDPEVDPVEASRHAAIVATGRSDYPNQINNVLAFPGFFRGLLDAHATSVTDDMMVAAATAVADAVGPGQLNPSYIVPSVFDPSVAPAVAAAVRDVAVEASSRGGGGTRD
jgi:malate dehydrogenase (oxaloacetate-decarboxylating)